MNELYAVAAIVKAHGIRGEVVVRNFTDSHDRFRSLRAAYLGATERDAVPCRITRAVIEPRGVRLKIEGVETRTAAEERVGQLLFVDVEHRVKLPAGSFFVDDLIGMPVYDDDDVFVGTLREIVKMPAQDVFVVDAFGKELLIPGVKEFVQRVDPTAKRITVHLIEGMREA